MELSLELARWIATAETAGRVALGRLPEGKDHFAAALVTNMGPLAREARTLPGRETLSSAVSWPLAGALHGLAEALAVRALNGDADPEKLVDAFVALALTIEKLDERDVLVSAGRVYEATIDRKLDGDGIIAKAREVTGGQAEAFLGRFSRRPVEMRGAAIGADVVLGPPGDRRFVSASLFPDLRPRS